MGGRAPILHYEPETDSLYIDLRDRVVVETIEVARGLVVAIDGEGTVRGIDIDHASKLINLGARMENLPVLAGVKPGEPID